MSKERIKLYLSCDIRWRYVYMYEYFAVSKLFVEFRQQQVCFRHTARNHFNRFRKFFTHLLNLSLSFTAFRRLINIFIA